MSFEDKFPVGMQVRFWSGVREGEGKLGQLSYPGIYQISGLPGLYVRGKGFIALTHMEAVTPDEQLGLGPEQAKVSGQ